MTFHCAWIKWFVGIQETFIAGDLLPWARCLHKDALASLEPGVTAALLQGLLSPQCFVCRRDVDPYKAFFQQKSSLCQAVARAWLYMRKTNKWLWRGGKPGPWRTRQPSPSQSRGTAGGQHGPQCQLEQLESCCVWADRLEEGLPWCPGLAGAQRCRGLPAFAWWGWLNVLGQIMVPWNGHPDKAKILREALPCLWELGSKQIRWKLEG